MKGVKITGKKRKYKFKIIGFIEIKKKKKLLWFIGLYLLMCNVPKYSFL